MKKINLYLLACGLALTLGACSSSQTSEELGDEESPVVDAGTDAVPSSSAEDVAEAPPPAADADSGGDVPPPPLEEPVAETAANEPPPVSPDPLAAPPPAPDPEVAKAPEAPAPTPASAGGEPYTVQQGDTLMKIAFETYGDLFKWRQIYEANKDKISDPNAVPPGTVLMLEGAGGVTISRNGEKYLIKRGDTLGTISEDVYGTKTKWKRIWENNKELIHDPNRIFAGFFLYYTMTPEDREELERYKSAPESQTPALANAPGAPAEDSARNPASGAAGVPSFQAPPAQ
ncbi:MAG: LysM peptidoglycan-binding domain-containing protein [Oligoflexia bacterium]|nr:LysM peptidoglycan-binding domain-containing protein [Oligoflexia bacterium]